MKDAPAMGPLLPLSTPPPPPPPAKSPAGNSQQPPELLSPTRPAAEKPSGSQLAPSPPPRQPEAGQAMSRSPPPRQPRPRRMPPWLPPQGRGGPRSAARGRPGPLLRGSHRPPPTIHQRCFGIRLSRPIHLQTPNISTRRTFPGQIVVDTRKGALDTAGTWRGGTIWTDGSGLDSGNVGAACTWRTPEG